MHWTSIFNEAIPSIKLYTLYPAFKYCLLAKRKMLRVLLPSLAQPTCSAEQKEIIKNET